MDEINKAVDFMKNYFSNSDLNIQEFESEGYRSLFICTHEQPDIIFHGHLDVVGETDMEQFVPRIEGDKLYGRGSLDMKSGVMVGSYLINHFHKEMKHSFGMLITTDEEIGGMNGAKIFFEQLDYKPKLFLTLEGDPKFKIFNREKGIAIIRLSAKGKSAHGSKPWDGDNAIEKLTNCLHAIKATFPCIKEDWKTTCSFTDFKCMTDTGVNVIPDDAMAIVDIRFVEDLKGIESQVKELAEKNNCSFELLISGDKVDTNCEDYICKELFQSYEAVLGSTPEVAYMHGASDARFASGFGVPALIWGPRGNNHHGPGEYVEISSIEKLYNVLKHFLV